MRTQPTGTGGSSLRQPGQSRGIGCRRSHQVPRASQARPKVGQNVGQIVGQANQQAINCSLTWANKRPSNPAGGACDYMFHYWAVAVFRDPAPRLEKAAKTAISCWRSRSTSSWRAVPQSIICCR